MTSTVRIQSLTDVAAFVPRLLGFHPENSLVVLPFSGGPIARIDIGAPHDLAGAFASALGHWSKVAVVAYTDSTFDAGVLEVSTGVYLPGIEVAAFLRVHGGRVFGPGDSDGLAYNPDAPTGTSLDVKHVAASRNEHEMDAAEVSDIETAELLALESYKAGDGARAWTYCDRVRALNDGKSTPPVKVVEAALVNAIDPATLNEELS